MPLARRIAIVPLAACVLFACTKTEQTTTRTPLRDPVKTLVRDKNAGGFIGGTLRPDGTAIVGSMRWKRACHLKTTQRVELREVETVRPDYGANAAWLIAGGALLGGMGYALHERSAASTAETNCTTADDGSTGCISDKEKWGNVAIVTGAAGGLAALVGIVGMAGSSKTTVGEDGPSVVEHQDPSTVPCGKVEDLEGLELVVKAPGLARTTTRVEASGALRLQLPERENYDGDEKAQIYIGEVPEKLRSFVMPNSLAGEISMRPYASTLAERKAAQDQSARAARAEADQQVFSDAIHGDLAARQALTFACTPTGKDVCYDAIDNDCDGLYDIACGYRSGALQWTLAWGTQDDLDLHVVGPDKAHVYFGNRKGASAQLELDIDCLGMFGNNCLAQNIENIFSPPTSRPMQGTYRGWVEVFREAATDDGQEGRIIEAMLGGRVAGKTFRMPMSLPASKGSRVYFAFAIGPDKDEDSVIDAQDACPGVPGPYSDVAGECGCPDKDGDGIADSVDECPDERGLRQASSRNKKGCPRSYGKVGVTDCSIEIREQIHFATDSAAIPGDPGTQALLSDIGAAMRDMPQTSLVIEGHTDDRGTTDHNAKLSAHRAQAVRDVLVRRERVPAASLHTRGVGPFDPLQPNTSDANRAMNRRVVFKIIDAPNCGSGSW